MMDINKIHLSSVQPQERIITVARHHWFIYVRDLVGIALLFFLPFFAIPLLNIFITAGGGPVSIPDGYGLFFASLWALFLWQVLFSRWTDVYFDIWIVTNWRIIDIDQKGFFNREVATLLDLEKIEDVTVKLNSVIGNLLGYGDLQIQTGAVHREFIFPETDNPGGLEKIIRRAQEEHLGLRPHA